MLAAAEPDLETHRVDGVGKQRGEIGRRCEVDREARQQLFDQRGVMWPQAMALAAAEEGAVAPAVGWCGDGAVFDHPHRDLGAACDHRARDRNARSATSRAAAYFYSGRSRLLLGEPAQILDEIGALPGEAAIGLRRAAEMAVGAGARVDRAVEPEMLADAARA